jgi:acyl-CoA synthetase (NDP forming)
VIRVTTLRELFDVTALLANQPLPRGRRVGVLTNAGGPGILAVDALESQGLEIVEFSEQLRGQLQALLSPDAAVANPVDMIASAGAAQYRACLDLLFASDEVDAVLVIYIPASPEGVREIAEVIRDAGLRHQGVKTFIAVYMSAGDVPAELASGGGRVPTFPFPEQAARALAKAATYSEWRERPEGVLVEFADIDDNEVRTVIDRAIDRLGDADGWLDPGEVDAVLAACGLPLPKSGTVKTEDEAVDLAASIGGSVVLKVISPSALHKSDVGGVVLDVEGDDEVRAAFHAVSDAVTDSEGVLIQEYVGGGHEVLIGMTEDPVFGPLIVFGLGGVFVELVGDVAFRIHPLTDLEAGEMMREVKTAKLLDGYRGGDPGDLDALREALLRVSTLVELVPEIIEMDMNPVKVHAPGAGINVVDARIKVRRVKGPWVPSRRDIPSAI